MGDGVGGCGELVPGEAEDFVAHVLEHAVSPTVVFVGFGGEVVGESVYFDDEFEVGEEDVDGDELSIVEPEELVGLPAFDVVLMEDAVEK